MRQSGTSTANFNSTAPTSTVFSVGNTTATNGTGTYVAYCFAEIAWLLEVWQVHWK